MNLLTSCRLRHATCDFARNLRSGAVKIVACCGNCRVYHPGTQWESGLGMQSTGHPHRKIGLLAL